MHERGRADQRLHEIRAQRVLEQRGRRALRVDIPGGHGLIVDVRATTMRAMRALRSAMEDARQASP